MDLVAASKLRNSRTLAVCDLHGKAEAKHCVTF